jgi:hypothetical protein
VKTIKVWGGWGSDDDDDAGWNWESSWRGGGTHHTGKKNKRNGKNNLQLLYLLVMHISSQFCFVYVV